MQDSIPVGDRIENDIGEAYDSLWVHIKNNQDSIEENERRLISRAIEFAWPIHDGRQRDEGTAYMIHPIRVATEYIQRWEQNKGIGAVISLLHDVLEDGSVTKDDLKNKFAIEIAEAVSALTKDKEFPEPEMRRRYLSQLHNAPEIALRVKMVDRIDNLRSLYLILDTDREKAVRYVRYSEENYLQLAQRVDGRVYEDMAGLISTLSVRLGK